MVSTCRAGLAREPERQLVEHDHSLALACRARRTRDRPGSGSRQVVVHPRCRGSALLDHRVLRAPDGLTCGWGSRIAPASPPIDAGSLRGSVWLVVADVRSRNLLGLLQ